MVKLHCPNDRDPCDASRGTWAPALVHADWHIVLRVGERPWYLSLRSR